jgi:hypothetical protein
MDQFQLTVSNEGNLNKKQDSWWSSEGSAWCQTLR